MPTTEPDNSEVSTGPTVLLTGASGYVGGRLIPLLEAQPLVLRCLARNPDKLRPLVKGSTEIVRGDVLDAPSLGEALQGIQTAYYLVHLMSGSHDFEKEDRQAATNFADSAKRAGVRRIIYLGGLGDDTDPTLSPHLRSRHEVGEILPCDACHLRSRSPLDRRAEESDRGAGPEGVGSISDSPGRSR